ncbi:DUF5683 domain-containing protein [Arcicella rigui]|uniref:DUF5683 domain-containing protein n=1 Tax=Arcicella rigui TaxID=797020 RepID=A0ABU5Q8V6_9BACT|nr:DUF5683 domain-containing protein [Arcicella rigui]MEA5139178.1 DUF5683 domain-containing protein [Arcicella rigui]
MKKLLVLLFFCTGFSVESQAQVLQKKAVESLKDTLVSKIAKIDSVKKPYKIIPRLATLHSLMVPGWGQIYNRQYWKLPLVYGGFAVNIYYIITNQKRYTYYKQQYISNFQVTSPPSSAEIYLYGDTSGIPREYTSAQLNTIVNGYRRNRDGSYLFLAVVWAANIIDANVTAHLKTFDLTDDISLKIQPTLTSPDMMNAVYGAKLTFAFK